MLFFCCFYAKIQYYGVKNKERGRPVLLQIKNQHHQKIIIRIKN